MTAPQGDAFQIHQVVEMFQMKKERQASVNRKNFPALVCPEEKACSICSSGTKAMNSKKGNPCGGQERKKITPLRNERSKSFFLVIQKKSERR